MYSAAPRALYAECAVDPAERAAMANAMPISSCLSRESSDTALVHTIGQLAADIVQENLADDPAGGKVRALLARIARLPADVGDLLFAALTEKLIGAAYARFKEDDSATVLPGLARFSYLAKALPMAERRKLDRIIALMTTLFIDWQSGLQQDMRKGFTQFLALSALLPPPERASLLTSSIYLLSAFPEHERKAAFDLLLAPIASIPLHRAAEIEALFLMQADALLLLPKQERTEAFHALHRQAGIVSFTGSRSRMLAGLFPLLMLLDADDQQPAFHSLLAHTAVLPVEHQATLLLEAIEQACRLPARHHETAFAALQDAIDALPASPYDDLSAALQAAMTLTRQMMPPLSYAVS